MAGDMSGRTCTVMGPLVLEQPLPSVTVTEYSPAPTPASRAEVPTTVEEASVHSWMAKAGSDWMSAVPGSAHTISSNVAASGSLGSGYTVMVAELVSVQP